MRFLKIIISLALSAGLLVLSTGVSAHETGTPGSVDALPGNDSVQSIGTMTMWVEVEGSDLV